MGNCAENLKFWSSLIGILKIAEFILSLLIVIMTSASQYTTIFIINGRTLPTQQMAFVNFVGAFCCVTLLISGVIYSLGIYKLPLFKKLPWRKLEIFYAGLCAVLYFIAMAIAGHSSNNTKVDSRITNGINLHNLFAAISVFCAITLLVFGAQVFIILRDDDFHSGSQGKNNPTNVET